MSQQPKPRATDVTLDRSQAEVAELLGDADGPAVVRIEASLDVDIAPLTAYAALGDESEYSFLLESAEKVASSDPAGAFSPSDSTGSADRHARFSFVGYDPEAVVTVTPEGTEVDAFDDRVADLLAPGEGDVLDQLRGTLPDVERLGFPASDRQHLDGGLVGFLAYDAVYDLWLDEVGVERPEAILPDAQFVLTTKTLVFDEAEESLSLVCTPIVRPDDDPEAVYDDVLAEATRVADALADAEPPETGGFRRTDETAGPQEEYEEAVRTAKQHVLDGDIYQGVISRKRELYGDVDTLGFYEALRAVNPSPYMYLLKHGDRSIVGASPETLVSVQGRRIVSNPIAGTCSRGTSPVEDRRLAGEMLADDKERSEHTMLVDLARNDVRRVSEAGSVRVEEFMNVLKYSHVQHIESTVTGTMADEYDAFDATRVTFPAGTLSGAPKVRAMEIIDDLELSPRGVYGGGVGYYSWTGDADFAIVIRTATIDHGVETERGREDRITVQAGAGIVADSDPTSEYEETEKKMGGVLAAIKEIEEEP
ncbi:anthranilate synthase, component I [Halogranum gelatinilyticum]|uniref:Anthranilate synthase component 1 n=1 Tax=Halogranum gelatinilyticum TaxID=660521 RepID=A0A1G9UKV8_9EURY|nr:anthranilate synthase component I [Halogranum gelatinilyticum]SDM60569.1 anthranilate synthase, component I [Halogranum gelatinilyticum]